MINAVVFNKRTGTYPSDVTMMKTVAGYIYNGRAREIAGREIRRIRKRRSAGEHSGRERSAEAENARPPVSCRVSGGWR